MEDSGIPTKIPVVWASSPDAGTFRVVPTAPPAQNGAASLEKGFPGATIVPIAAGGSWPFAQDTNGILNLITAWLQWNQAGGPIAYDAAFSAAIGGYPKGAVISSATLGGFWLCTVDNNTTDPDTGGAGWVNALAGRLLNVQTFTATSTYTPTPGMRTGTIEGQGGGGAGGGATGATGSNVSLGAPGCSGAYAKGIFTAAEIGASLSVTIGAGGAAVSGGTGGTGGTTSVGTLMTCPGGPGGNTLTNQVPPTTNGNGTTSSAPAGGNIFSSVGSCASPTVALTSAVGYTGAGGASIFGPGAPSIAANETGPSAQNFGAGGGGIMLNASGGTAAGGSGKSGIVIIWEYA